MGSKSELIEVPSLYPETSPEIRGSLVRVPSTWMVFEAGYRLSDSASVDAIEFLRIDTE